MSGVGVEAVDLFGGPGGWDYACKVLGLDPLGIEWDDAACETREAVGLRTLQADVSKLRPVDHGPAELIIGSPPCPTFSSAGNGGGRHLTEIIVRCLHELAAGNDTRFERREEAFAVLLPIYRDSETTKAAKKKREPDLVKAEARARRDAEMSLLVVEPLRWIVALKPRWIALEQVPDVLGLWSEMAQILGTLGYFTWTGVMEAERYGVPQTRERAILIADREAPVHPPRPTHQRYVKGEPQRHEVTMEGEVLPWVSMAEALGWVEGIEPSPAPTVSGGGTAGGGGVEVFAGTHARARVLRANAQPNAAVRSEDEPAPTITGGHDTADRVWVYNRPSPTIVTTRRSDKGILVGRQLEEGEGRNIGGRNWGGGGPTPHERPATTVAGDPRLSSPTHHNHGEQNAHAIRVTLEEAAILQSFPPDYPFQGTKSKRFEQVGNAVPPQLAHAILSSLLAPVLTSKPESEVAA